MSYTFNILSESGKIHTVVQDTYKKALSFEQELKAAKEQYQILNTGASLESLPDHSTTPESAYQNYQDKPVVSWLEQIEQMREESCQVNFKDI